ncbi:MAG: glycosyltransferase [Cyanobacteria bacterium LVE1205-1]|jgi:spore maturation protein CgeB
MATKLLIIGSHYYYDLGLMLLRSASSLGIEARICSNFLPDYAPSMNHILGKLFFKIAGKRPFEWWNFNQKVITLINHFQPELILVTGIFPLSNKVFKSAAKNNAKVVNYLTDNPYILRHKSPYFIKNISSYDLILSTKRRLIPSLVKKGARRVEFMFFAFDPSWNHIPDPHLTNYTKNFTADISFIGAGSSERLPELEALSSLGNLNLQLYGDGWSKIHINGWKKNPQISGDDFRLAIYSSKVTLGLLRKSNSDDSTMRTFEIPACGGCGIYEDTPEHRDLLIDYPEYGFFNSPLDLAHKCQWLLHHPQELQEMRQKGFDLIVKYTNTYASRLEKIFELVL